MIVAYERLKTMNFVASDPRAKLPTASRAVPSGPFARPQFLDLAHQRTTPTSGWERRASVVRGQNFVLRYSYLKTGDVITRADVGDESLVLSLSDQAEIRVETQSEAASLRAQGVIIAPAGPSRVVALADANIVELFTIAGASSDLAAENDEFYSNPSEHVALASASSDARGSTSLRAYALADVTPNKDRFGRIFKTTGLMVNFLSPYEGPRPSDRLSPHHHDDFEQGSFIVKGAYTHYIRTPWTPNLDHWEPDVAHTIGAPSLTIIPPPLIHTSRAIDDGTNQMIDIFSPPRRDFEEKGWVINAADYSD